MMNEHIRELAEHCDFYVGNEHHDKSHEEQQRLWAEKFAELIVKECVNTLEFHGFDDAVPYIQWMATNKLGVK